MDAGPLQMWVVGNLVFHGKHGYRCPRGLYASVGSLFHFGNIVIFRRDGLTSCSSHLVSDEVLPEVESKLPLQVNMGLVLSGTHLDLL